MSRTGVAAPAAEPFDELFSTIDQMDGPTLRAFRIALAKRYNPERCDALYEFNEFYSIRCWANAGHDGEHKF